MELGGLWGEDGNELGLFAALQRYKQPVRLVRPIHQANVAAYR